MLEELAVANLGLITQNLARFVDEYINIISANLLIDDGFQHLFFGSYLYALFRLAESEYEDAEDPFPKGRIPFLTIHQAKGLEFPVVILWDGFQVLREWGATPWLVGCDGTSWALSLKPVTVAMPPLVSSSVRRRRTMSPTLAWPALM